MIRVKKIVVGNLKTNCYIVYNTSTMHAIIIDAGDEYNKIKECVLSLKLKVGAILLTHGHYDHIGACRQFQNDGINVYIHQNDANKCEDNKLNLSSEFSSGTTQTFKPNFVLSGDNANLKIDEFDVLVINTPGHSEGSCCFIINNYLFSGDTIFDFGYGRTDFYDGSMQKLRNSIKKLKPYLNGDYILCAGH